MYEVKTGIYKITSPSGKVYIGQSTDIDKRFVTYKNSGCRFQVRLQRSFNKYGLDAHVFEIMELCEENQLNERERHYQDQFDVLGCNGMNCRLTTTDDKSGKLSDEVKQKMAEARKHIDFENVIKANQRNGKAKKEKNNKLIEEAIEQLKAENKEVNKTELSRLTGLSRMKIHRYFSL